VIENELWGIARTLLTEDPRSQPASLFTQALNDVIDIREKRRFALDDDRVPSAVTIMLFAVSMAAMGMVAYSCGLSGRRRAMANFTFACLIALVLVISLDIDSPARRVRQGQPGQPRPVAAIHAHRSSLTSERRFTCSGNCFHLQRQCCSWPTHRRRRTRFDASPSRRNARTPRGRLGETRGLNGEIELRVDPALGAEVFSIEPSKDRVLIRGGDLRGLIYGALAAREQLLNGVRRETGRQTQPPALAFRGIKFNTPVGQLPPSSALDQHYDDGRAT
jgi:hypothetical protein